VLLEATADELAALLGPHDAHRKLLEELAGVRLSTRHGRLVVAGGEGSLPAGAALVRGLLQHVRQGRRLSGADIRFAALQLRRDAGADVAHLLGEHLVVTHRGTPVLPKTPGQASYVRAISEHDLTFCLGPAGTGKTYLAMAMAVAALRDETVSRIVLSRPIVEAGEALGYLPGNVMDKVDPYLRPLHDALQDILGADRFQRHVARGAIEVIPLAYMRGRTLNDAFIVLDEAQNSTPMQMKMALTRLGFGAKMVVTGDITQTDLAPGRVCGLAHALGLLRGLPGVACCELTGEDIVRHDLVQRIVSAYDRESRTPDDAHPTAPQG
jgi:phosphate starvation-inducible PhoH-like protein